MADLLTDAEIDERLSRLDGWAREGDAIHGPTTTATSSARLSSYAGSRRRRRRWATTRISRSSWNEVRVAITSHSAGGLTASDFELASRIDALD